VIFGMTPIMTIQVRGRGTLTLTALREKYRLGEGYPLTGVDLDGAVLLSPRLLVVPRLAAEMERLRRARKLSLKDLGPGPRRLSRYPFVSYRGLSQSLPRRGDPERGARRARSSSWRRAGRRLRGRRPLRFPARRAAAPRRPRGRHPDQPVRAEVAAGAELPATNPGGMWSAETRQRTGLRGCATPRPLVAHPYSEEDTRMTWRPTLGVLGMVLVLAAGCARRDSAMTERKPLEIDAAAHGVA
jgi:hypothetical protein